MRRTAHLLLIALLLAACGGWRGGDRLMSRADSLMYARPAAALALLDCIPEADRARMSKGQRMRYELLRADAQNKNFVKFTTDSVLKAVVSYYDSHGTPNERMRANYLLGRAYYDMGETHLALKYYHEAADCADTTQIDCDYKLLSRVHGQMGRLLLDHDDPNDAYCEYQEGRRLAKHINDTLFELSCYNALSSVYELLGNKDSAVSVAKEVGILYDKYGYPELASMAVAPVIDILVSQGKMEEARRMMERYESVPSLFDKNHCITKGREIYYAVKGDYFLRSGAIDSSFLYFKRLLQYGTSPYHIECGYEGLSRVYKQKGMLDSAFHCSSLAYLYKDSTNRTNESTAFQRNHQLYSHSRTQQLIERKTNEAAQAKFNWLLTIALFLVFAIGMTIILVTVRNRYRESCRRQKELNERNSHLELVRKDLELAKKELSNLLSLKTTEIMDLSKKLESVSNTSSTLRSIIDEKRKDIEDKRQRIILLEAQIRNATPPPHDSDDLIKNLPIVSVLRRQLKQKGSSFITDSQSKELKRSIDDVLPNFLLFLESTKRELRPDEKMIIYLTRSYFRNSEIATLINMKPSAISMIKKRLLVDTFGLEGGARDFDSFIKDFC